jgi:hypothetical protein
MLRTGVFAAALALCTALPALAQNYPPELPPGYMQAPPQAWEDQELWHRKKEAERHAFWEEWRHASWRCDHGDRGACRWLHEHEHG